MAVFQITFFSGALRRQVNLAAVVPMDVLPGMKAPEIFKPAYLLHGFAENQTTWLTNVPLPRLAEKYGYAMFMPCGENSFYLNDSVLDYRYEDFICEELPAFCRTLFPLSCRREDTVIAGNSMGGFGALHNGLSRPDIFGNIIALSCPVNIVEEASQMKEGEKDADGIGSCEYYRHIFGNPATDLRSNTGPRDLVKKFAKTPETLPRIYLACGTADFLADSNRDFHVYLESLQIKHEYWEEPGFHDWNLFSACFSKALERINENQ
ncbi:MAG: hypothetical protein LBD18_01345 [Treponema sp.]|jgi:S-formylglutathione hydrolase FrmB|nr:hypothetical protein [Treponema sp.]